MYNIVLFINYIVKCYTNKRLNAGSYSTSIWQCIKILKLKPNQVVKSDQICDIKVSSNANVIM